MKANKGKRPTREELIELFKRVDALFDNLWKGVPWGQVGEVDFAALNEVPGEVKRILKTEVEK